MSHKVELDRRSIKKRILQLDCAGKLPPHAGRLPAAVAARGAGQKVCGDGTVAGVRRRARRTRAAEGRSVPAREPRERVQKELAVTRCRAVVVLWRLCTVGKVRLQQRSTMVVPRCSLA
ncbi:hypothetical protein EMIHUDRAFT_309766 [Emiliania huxleyi CCMP1516]|uniref:Uncharacterized protein n=2 Tax=Emiliania huxleyi TaxID=2903 RepID=A0A0D3I293_EMIH1|nr:hypothetical protein EMIHUDRAFT_308976 [Emiliania huxleyi CCMP1516]XP_005781978.1 hypothetical protein EMIHUDRAFT_317771 [Emiliania huxleyi CCMP1516]XP_005782611.1 hypothetical protein EMIHUDRAFT_309766 [Emiliania huxleyi CCMP1516]EOD05378.1 hypothetical protein EMIHUDRAFT_308976 [Emiliania huxleyi CCMP1516]EOD29549.1 hypothetical protein EMIHUDRAFT_317771 [Emiliania huxleyi CCMP1516]EOD30182.1 hypothetical protein EMIHUDRAFT_309766 [Emiliania huxleyi CCMP1516]|eukprot:XP_005757807.1 hypothetical protein EMIHUDRAFT_308976 [Emiliania huxleyi CCMP1516]